MAIRSNAHFSICCDAPLVMTSDRNTVICSHCELPLAEQRKMLSIDDKERYKITPNSYHINVRSKEDKEGFYCAEVDVYENDKLIATCPDEKTARQICEALILAIKPEEDLPEEFTEVTSFSR